MHRRVLTIAIAAGLVPAAAAVAGAKPRVAVLGLEVIAEGGMDEGATRTAAQLTMGLRQRASIERGPYELAPDSNKDLVEMKLLSDCGDEGMECMAGIGKELNADFVLYGRLQKAGDGYEVTLNLLDVAKGDIERTVTEVLSGDDARGAGLRDWARSLYNRLTGVVDEGTLVVKANIRNGTVFIDGDSKGNLAAGRASIDHVVEGEHAVSVFSEGYKPWEGSVTITAGQSSEVTATLVRGEGPPMGGSDGGRPGGASRVLFWTSLVATGAGVAAFTVTGLQVRGSLEDDKLDAIRDLESQEGIDLDRDNACDDAENFPESSGAQRVVDACNKGRSRATLTNVLIGATVVTALAASYFYYKGYVSPGSGSSEARRAAARRRRAEPLVRVTPAVGPTVVGAGIEIKF